MEHVTLPQMIECVDRELGFRQRVYPRWINAAKPKITPKKAEEELARMRAVRARLVRSVALEAVIEQLRVKAGMDVVTLVAMEDEADHHAAKAFPTPKGSP